MTTYLLWDAPTSTLLLETLSFSEVRESINTFIQDNGDAILAELLLGIEEPATDVAQSFTGSDIVAELGRRADEQHRSSLKRTA